MTSLAISNHLKPNSENLNRDIPGLLQLVSTDSEESGASDTEVIEVPISADFDYQKSLSTIIPQSSSTTTTTSHKQKSFHPPLT